MRVKRLLQQSVVAGLVLLPIAAPGYAEDANAGFTADFIADFERAGKRLAGLAGATPAEKFSWAPTDEVRTISEVYAHVVFTNTFLPMALGAAPPEGLEVSEDMNPMALMKQWEETITTKDDVIAKLNESFAYAAEAVPTITDLETIVETFGFPGTKRAYLLILLTHAHEHLGQSIAYARSIGVVPPWSQQQAEGGGN
jgi:uncharacterized damage-inducible protein DinB